MSKSKPIDQVTSSLKQKSLLDFYETTISKISIEEIQINERIRSKPDQIQIDRLAESINKIGLLNPITITKNKRLVAGYHRLQACKKLGWLEIPCIITTVDDSLLLELLEIDENLIRYELDLIDQGKHLKRRKEIYEIFNPETKKGIAGGIASGIARRKKEDLTTAPSAVVQKSFVEDTAEKTGISERNIFEAIQIVEKTSPEVQEYIQKKNIGKKDALKIARIEKQKQWKVIEKLEQQKAKKVGEAIAQMKRDEKIKEIKEKQPEHQKTDYIPEIYLVDALNFLNSIENESVDLLFTDPSYMTDIDLDIALFANQWVPKALDKVKDTGRVYIFTGAYPEELSAYLNVLLSQDRFILGNVLVWTYRNTLGPSPDHAYKNNWQAIFYLYGKKALPLNTNSLNEKFSVMDFNAPDGRQANNFFKWQKPDDLAEMIVRHSTQENDLVIDPFAGSGTFVLKATEMKRRAKGSEIDPITIDIAIKRGCVIKNGL